MDTTVTDINIIKTDIKDDKITLTKKVDNIETMVTETNTAVVQVKQSQAEMMQKLDNIEVMMNGLCVRGPIRRGEGGGLNGSASSGSLPISAAPFVGSTPPRANS